MTTQDPTAPHDSNEKARSEPQRFLHYEALIIKAPRASALVTVVTS
jgi:hypothetical protein